MGEEHVPPAPGWVAVAPPPVVGGDVSENQLLKRMDPSLLRGVSLSVCLSRFGQHWSSHAHSMYEVTRDYDPGL